ncbi:MAG: AsmA family protein, partial [Gammaproteobacteria bacterium]
MTKRFRKNLILSIAAGLVVLLLAPILALQYLDWNPHRDRLGRWISVSLNRSVEIAGPLEIQLWPVAQLKVGGLRIASPDEGFKSPLLDIGTASIDLNLGALFSKTVLIDHLEVDSSSLSLQVLADGRNNWTFRGADPSQTDSRAGWTTIVRVAEINDVKLSFLGKNPRFDQRWEIHKLNSSLPEGRNESALVLRGLYNGTPLSIDGSLTLLGDDDLEAALRVDLGASSGTVSGLIKDVMAGGDASLAIQLATSNLSETITTFIPGATDRARELLMGKGSASAVLKGRLNESIRLEDVELVTESELLRITSSGDVELWRRGQGLLPECDLGVFLETEALSELAILFGGGVPFDAKAEARGILRGSLRDFRFDGAIFEASGPLVEISGSGRLERMGSDSGMWLDFETKVETLDVGSLMSAYRLSLPLDGAASATARVWGGRGSVRVDNIQTEIASGTGNLRLAGAIGPLGPSAKYQLPFEGSSRDLRNELSGFGWEIPEGWTGSMKGLLSGDQGSLFARDLDIELSSKIMTVSLGGSVGPLGSAAVYQLPFRAATPDLAAAASLLGKTLPFSGSASAQGILTGQKTELSVTGLNAQARNELGLLRLDGELGL